MRQSLHHLVVKAPWSDEVLLGQVRHQVLPAMQKHRPVVAWIGDDTGFPKKGKHSVGVTRQYCGQVGKQDNCRVAVSLSVATGSASLPIAYRLYLPKDWAEDTGRRQKAEVPEAIDFQTKPEIALEQIRQAVTAEVDRGVVLADAAYGMSTGFREALTELKLALGGGCTEFDDGLGTTRQAASSRQDRWCPGPPVQAMELEPDQQFMTQQY